MFEKCRDKLCKVTSSCRRLSIAGMKQKLRRISTMLSWILAATMLSWILAATMQLLADYKNIQRLKSGESLRMAFASGFKRLNIAFYSMLRRGPRPLVLCGPSGTGKSTLIKRLFEEFPDTFGFSVSHTTREPRVGEVHGKHYYFTDKEKMQNEIDRGEFIESAVFSDNMYGTSKKSVEDVKNNGKVCVLDIDMQGVMQIKNSDLDPLLIFIKPPSIPELENRLKGRKTETQESLQRRLSVARAEIEYGELPGNFHAIIVNDDLDKAYEKLREIVMEELKRYRDIQN